MMSDEAVRMFYTGWCESRDYDEQSVLENGVYDRINKQIKDSIGADAGYKISDYIMSIVCDSEYAGFESGLRCGILLMQDIQRGGAV